MLYRDLGGIKNKEGKIIKKNYLLRSANLSRINSRTLHRLEKDHLYKIIDLRTDEEISEKPNKIIAGVQYIQLPIFNEKTVGITREKDIEIKEMLHALPDLAGLYKSMVTNEYSVAQLKQIMHEIIDSNGYPVLFHCSAGKDRTGIVSLLLLSILDVSEDKIIKDYLYDSKKHQLKSLGLYFTLIFMTRDKELASRVRKYYLVDEKYMMTSMQAINEKYGSMDIFIRNELCVSDVHKEEFKRRVLKAWEQNSSDWTETL